MIFPRFLVLASFLAVSVLVASPSGAQDAAVETKAPPLPEAPPERPPTFTINGCYWFHWNRTKAFALDEKGFEDGLDQYFDHRLRVKPTVNVSDSVRIAGSFDFLAGQLAGDTTTSGADVLIAPRDQNRFYGRAMPRELYVEWRSAFGLLRAGQQTSTWGLGLVANGGEDRDDEFSDTRFGDLVERVMFATRPFQAVSNSDFARHFTVAVGGDLVFMDDHANLLDKDLAFQGIAAFFYDGKESFLGLYGAYRNQKYDNGDRLWATVIDLYGRHSFRLDKRGSTLTVAGEGAFIFGRTDAARFERARDGLAVRSLGAAIRATGDFPLIGLIPGVEFGVASGDADIRDATSRAFTFDPDYQVGMILFPEVLGRMSARAADRVADPALVNQPVKGYELSATNGAITNAMYLYPKVRWQPIRRLEVRVAFLWARALAPIASPFNTAQNGGYPVSYRGGNGKGLGVELDGAVSYEQPIWGPLAVRFGFQGGWARPGDAFETSDGWSLGNLWKVRGLVDVRW